MKELVLKKCKKECKSKNSKVIEKENGNMRKLNCLSDCEGCDYDGGLCP